MSFTSSTIGITEKARARETAYSANPIGVKPNAFARKGTSITAVVSTRDAIIAPKRKKLWLP